MNLYCNNDRFEIKDKISIRNYINNYFGDEEENELHTIISKIFNCQKRVESIDEEYLFIPLNDYNLSQLKEFVNSNELLAYYSKELKKYKLDVELNSKNSFISIETIVEDNTIYFDYTIHFSLKENRFINSINKIKEILNKKSINVEIFNKSLAIITENDNKELSEALLAANCQIKILKNRILIKGGIYE